MFMPQTFAAYPDLTGSEFLEYSLCLRGGRSKQSRHIAGQWLEQVGLTHVGKARVISYSQGMLQRLGMAYTFQVKASAYLLDEPFAGVDPESRSSLIELLFQIGQTSVVIVSTHHLDEMQYYGAKVVRIQERTFVHE
jgi:ABC-2 type transport system ATP-binding protein